VRIAARVDVALAAVDVASRYVEHGNRLRDVEVAWSTLTDPRIPRAVEQKIHPSDLEVQPDEGEDIRLSQLQDEARLWIDEVRVLIALADVHDRDARAPDRPRDVVQIGRARDDI
jgi:hypothetical protein